MRKPGVSLVLALGLACALPAFAADDPKDDPVAADAQAKVAYFDKYAGKLKDDIKYAELVMDMATLVHPLTAERIGRILNTDADEERRLIAAAALSDFKKPAAARDAAGKQLLDALLKDKFTIEVTDTCVDSIGKIQYVPAWEKVSELLLKGGDPWLLVTTVRASGRLDDKRLLPALLELWERHPVGIKEQAGAEVKVDTGAAGDTDQKAAEAAWKAANQNKGRGKKPPVMLRAYIQELVKAVRAITDDETIGMPNELRTWMEDRRDELKALGIDVPKKKTGTKAPGKDGKDEKGGDGGKDEEKGEKGEKGGGENGEKAGKQ